MFILILIIFTLIVGCENLALLGPEEANRAFYRNINLSNQGKEKSFYTFLTYNIHMGFNSGLDPWDSEDIGATQSHLLRLIESIKSIDADFVALQEVADGRSNTEIQNQLKFLAERLNMNYAYGVDGENKPGQHGIRDLFATGIEGNAILSKYEIISAERTLIIHHGINNWHAGSVKADIRISDSTSITILNAHLTPSSDTLEVNLQIANVLEFANKQTFPTVIMGDFNKFPESVYIKEITERFPDTCDQVQNENSDFVKSYGTFLGCFFACRIDYVFTQPDIFHVIDVGLLSQEFWGLSDHVGYYAQIQF